LLFSVFNNTVTENKVNVKYKTKNNMTDDNPVFLAIKNHRNANISSVKNLMLTATSECIVWLSGSFFLPLKKIISTRSAIIVKTADASPISMYVRFTEKFETMRKPATSTSISRIARRNIDLASGFNRRIIF
jgi:hypothetical protein